MVNVGCRLAMANGEDLRASRWTEYLISDETELIYHIKYKISVSQRHDHNMTKGGQ